ncbi:hypothetical protein BDR26DRAFT_848675 [Obelidium mucronatum]|nr:hypothetical protein BDR26DRAFT_848675 [Obelidium mucronatum]
MTETSKPSRRIRPDLKKALSLQQKGKPRQALQLYQEIWNRVLTTSTHYTTNRFDLIKKEILDAYNLILANPLHQHSFHETSHEQFLKEIEKNTTEHSFHRGHAAYACSSLYHTLGRSDRAVQQLRKAITLLDQMSHQEAKEVFTVPNSCTSLTVKQLVELKPNGLLNICRTMLQVLGEEGSGNEMIRPALDFIREVFPADYFRGGMFGANAEYPPAKLMAMEQYITNQDRRLKAECWNCHCMAQEGLKMRLCSQCELVSYCSKECQGTAWRLNHKAICRSNRDLKKRDLVRVFGVTEYGADRNGIVFALCTVDENGICTLMPVGSIGKEFTAELRNVKLVIPVELRDQAETTEIVRGETNDTLKNLMDNFSKDRRQMVISSISQSMNKR